MNDEHRHPMKAESYDAMAKEGYDMSGWERIAPPPGEPVYKVRHFSNRAQRRAERGKRLPR